MALLRYFLVLLSGLSSAAHAGGEPVRQVELTMFALPETLWLAKHEGQHPRWEDFNDEVNAKRATRLFAIKAELAGTTPFVRRIGEDREFVEGWNLDGTRAGGIVPGQVAKRFVGTVVELTQKPAEGSGQPWRLKLNLEQHLSPPVMQRINYATAAAGAERAKLSVEWPQFEKLTWTGELAMGGEWRLAANVLWRPGGGSDSAPAMRYLVFTKGL